MRKPTDTEHMTCPSCNQILKPSSVFQGKRPDNTKITYGLFPMHENSTVYPRVPCEYGGLVGTVGER